MTRACFGGLTLCLLLLGVACQGATAEPGGVAATASPTVTSAPRTSVENTANTAAASSRSTSIEESVLAFADALVSGDLVVLVQSFTPSGLEQAKSLQTLSGSDEVTDITRAVAGEIRQKAPDRYLVTFEIDTSGAGSGLVDTTWIAQAGGWRVDAMSVRPR